MIQDVDESLRALVKRDALNGSKADVAFDAPTKEWSSRRNTPTVDLYLYDIREDLERREVMWEDIRGDARDPRLITERRPPARRFKLSYLVTAWTQRPEDEHRLLSALLACFLRHPTMPADALSGTLVETVQPILLNIALPPPQDRSGQVATVAGAPAYDLNPIPEVDRARMNKTPITEDQEEPSIAGALAAAERFGLDRKSVV